MSASWNLICCHKNHPALLNIYIYSGSLLQGDLEYILIFVLKMYLLSFIKIVKTVYHGLDIKIEQRLSNVVTVKTYENIVFERFEFILVSSRQLIQSTMV